MLVVISDLHFEEEKSNYIESPEKIIDFSRNLPAKAFRKLISRLAEEARDNDVSHMDFVFAGDVFDLHRTGLWFSEKNKYNVRPYVSNLAITPKHEEMLNLILDDIINDEKIAESLAVFQLLGEGKYCCCTKKELLEAKKCTCGTPKFPATVTIHYIPGNHDRLVNAAPSLRRKVRDSLGMEVSDARFENTLKCSQYHTLVRHGHEYDRYNFSADYSEGKYFPSYDVSDKDYDDAPFGDFVTVDVASRIPRVFRDIHRDEKILSNQQLEDVYRRLLEFDDLRPQAALFNYLISLPESNKAKSNLDQEAIWRMIEPVLKRILEDASNDDYFNAWLKKLSRPFKSDVIKIVRILMWFRPWRKFNIPFGLVRWLSNRAVSHMENIDGAEIHASREKYIKDRKFSFIVAGHTHHPATELIAYTDEEERYYVDTGTWRNRVPVSPKMNAFGRLKALTYVIIYHSGEDQGTDNNDKMIKNKHASVDFWSGVTQRWEKSV